MQHSSPTSSTQVVAPAANAAVDADVCDVRPLAGKWFPLATVLALRGGKASPAARAAQAQRAPVAVKLLQVCARSVTLIDSSGRVPGEELALRLRGCHRREPFWLEGAVLTVVDGEERRYGAGESFDVPTATPHQMGGAEGGAVVRWEVRPALRTAAFFERLYGMMADPDTEPSAYGEFFDEFSDEFVMTGPETR